jgi:hypothetical protein
MKALVREFTRDDRAEVNGVLSERGSMMRIFSGAARISMAMSAMRSFEAVPTTALTPSMDRTSSGFSWA